MTAVDLTVMRQVAEELYVGMVEIQHGSRGVDALKVILATIRQIYCFVEPQDVGGRIVICKALDDERELLPVMEAQTVLRYESISQDMRGPAVVQVRENGDLLLWNQREVDTQELAQNAVVYEYHEQAEYFLAKGERRKMHRIVEGYSSMFAIPTFKTLDRALDEYRTKFAKYSSCKILQGAWGDKKLLSFKAGPEFIMRDSLTQFLCAALRGAEVRPEQVVDETHPVDIKVTWMLTNRLALIEIKWLGKSKHSTGEWATEYTAARAVEGSHQLAGYLEANRVRAPEHRTRGYLVVFDGRRKGLKKTCVDIDRARGLHYANKEINYATEILGRDDFERPVRLFLEPRID